MLKRVLDILVSVFALVVVSPLLLVLILLVRCKLGRPVFFRQERAGKNGQAFWIIKLRSMTDGRDADGRLLPDAERLTPFGQWLRATSMDELPELWNILKGEMSLVGPRPLPVHYLPRYTAGQARRHEVLPGLTGWAQIHGRNHTTWSERFRLDVWYVDNQNILLDLKIMAITVYKVLGRKGVSAEGEATMHEFTGNGDANPKR